MQQLDEKNRNRIDELEMRLEKLIKGAIACTATNTSESVLDTSNTQQLQNVRLHHTKGYFLLIFFIIGCIQSNTEEFYYFCLFLYYYSSSIVTAFVFTKLCYFSIGKE